MSRSSLRHPESVVRLWPTLALVPLETPISYVSRLAAPRIKRLYQHQVGEFESDSRAIPLTALDGGVSLSRALLGQRAVADCSAVYTEQVNDLATTGVLQTIRFETSRPRYHVAAVERLEAAIAALPVLDTSDDVLPIVEIRRRKRLKLAAPVAGWRHGAISGARRNPERRGLQGLYPPADATAERIARRRIADLPLWDTARLLRISNASVRRLRDDGFLEEIILHIASSSRPHRCISAASLHRFTSQFVTLGQLAEQIGVEPHHLARKLDRQELPPVDPSQSAVRFYRRRDMPKSFS